VTKSTDWMEQAACRYLPLAVVDKLFFTTGPKGPEQRVCGGCPVNRQCTWKNRRKRADTKKAGTTA